MPTLPRPPAPAGRPRALVLAPFSEARLTALREIADLAYESWTDTRRLYDPEELGRRLGDDNFAILVIEADFVFAEVFDAAPGLRLVGVCRNTTGHVDVEAATDRRVLVVNTPSRNTQAVAEHALALMLSLARNVPRAHRYVVDGHWQNPAEPYFAMRGIELAGRTLGIVGLGAIGRRLAGIASALGMACLAHDPYVVGPVEVATPVDLDELLSRSDFVSVHVPHTSGTEGLLDSRRLGLMRPTSYLLNLSDAAIVVEDALVDSLRAGRLAGAAMDVFEAHPLPPDSPLLSLDKVVLTPHIGGATAETTERHSAMMAEDIRRFLAGLRPLNLVNPEVWPP